MFSVKETSSTFFLSSASIVSRTPFTERARRSNFQTTNTAPGKHDLIADFKNLVTDEIYSQRHCFLSFAEREINEDTLSDVIAVAFGEDYSIEVMSEFLSSRAIRVNTNFWDELKAELCFCLAAREKDNNLEAFLRIYRIFELVSVALPLFYATSESSYYKALNFLRGLASDHKSGDLSVFKRCIVTLSENGGYNDLKIDFHVTGNQDWVDEFKLQLNRKILSQLEGGGEFINNQKFEIAFKSMLSFIAVFRNRLFHNLLSQNNFKLDNLNGSDQLCKVLIDPTLNWLTILIVEIMGSHASAHT